MSSTTERTKAVLVVDLDGTLLRSDILVESFWSAFSLNWRIPFLSIAALRRGRAALKQYLARNAHLDVSTLPYNQAVIDYVARWRADGGKTALVTASDQSYATAIEEHLELFDEVHGSDGELNLKGEAKANFLTARFGENGFAYAGDAAADLPVWQKAQMAITVDVNDSVKARANQLGVETDHLTTSKLSPSIYLQAIRPHQWVKNILVFLPLLAAHQFTLSTFIANFLAFVSFSLIASSVYVINDLVDLKADRSHPRKKFRPFAAGTIPIVHGSVMAGVLLLSGAGIAALLGWQFFLVMVFYYLLTTAYSLDLKRRIILDICVLAGLYTTRIIAGGVSAGIPLSVWLLAFSIFFFLSLAAVKRQAELVDSAERGQLSASGRGYLVNDLPIMSTIALVSGYMSVLVMMLYVNSPAVRELYQVPEVLWGVCAILLYWITRVVFVTHRGLMNDDPIIYAFKDRTSQLSFVLILGVILAGALA